MTPRRSRAGWPPAGGRWRVSSTRSATIQARRPACPSWTPRSRRWSAAPPPSTTAVITPSWSARSSESAGREPAASRSFTRPAVIASSPRSSEPGWPALLRGLRVIAEIGPQPAFDFAEIEPAPQGLVRGRVLADAPDREVPRRRMGEKQPADAGGGGHGERFCQGHVELLGFQQVEEDLLLAVVGAGRVAERGADAAEPLGVQILDLRVGLRLEPGAPCLQVNVLGEGLGETVREGLHHDRPVVVLAGFEGGRERFGAVDGHGEPAEMVSGRGHIVREAAVGPAGRLGRLLAQHRQPDAAGGAPVRVSVDQDVVAIRAGRPEAVDTAGLEAAPGDDLVEQGIRLVVQLAGHRLVEDRRGLTFQLPGPEEELPVD